MRGKAIIFSAPSGAGKTTIVHHLLQQGLGLEFSISATSRAPRPVERDGKDYHYMSVEAFKEKIENDEFVEWEEVYDNQYYGTLKSEVERIWDLGKSVIFDVDVVGGLNLKSYFGKNALAIFIQPPSVQTLIDRLRSRHTETEESIARRMEKARQELDFADKFDTLIINDNLEEAQKQALEIVKEYLQS